MLVTTKQILAKAQRGKYAVAAFNVNNMEILQSVIEAAVESKSPIIVQTSEGAIEYAGLDYLYMLMRLASYAPIPVAIHLDHGKDLKLIKQCIDIGYTSVMIDGSSLPFEENVKKTQQVVKWAKAKGVSVEAELGAIKGIEDLVSVSEKDAFFTSPEQAVEFVKRTECDSLAVSIGTSHGYEKFKGKPKLDLDRLKVIRKKVSIPLVLHGASEVDQRMLGIIKKYKGKMKHTRGVEDGLLKKVVKLGICKVNTDTDLRLSFAAGIREVVFTQPEVWDPRKLMAKAKQYMKEIAMERMKVLGSAGKAKG